MELNYHTNVYIFQKEEKNDLMKCSRINFVASMFNPRHPKQYNKYHNANFLQCKPYRDRVLVRNEYIYTDSGAKMTVSSKTPDIYI